ncbi:MAG TPA: MurT ligase domain-containing protein [Nocardioidaceae bacterium]|nr:MurT ligase domain-containing protein [Nocardioidaceae bacterium]
MSRRRASQRTSQRGTPRVAVAARLGRLAERLSRSTGLGSGGVIGGRVLLALAPQAPRELARNREVVLVSGTNGKTTTSTYLTACLRTRSPVDHNADGANTPAGIVRALAAGSAPVVVLETDEGWLPWTLEQTRARTAVLLNLSRDQLHRHHEVAAVASSWHSALSGLDHAVANCDDPDVVFSALAASRQTWVGVGIRWTQDALVCPRCGQECRRTAEDWRCTCGLRRPTPHWRLEGADLVGDTRRVALQVGLPGQANLANAAMAVVAATTLGADPQDAADSLRDIVSIAGRYDVLESAGRRARLILAKNPAGWVEALGLVSAGTAPLVLAFSSDGVDGRDPSWLYDVPFAGITGRPVVVTGRRATDMVVRLQMDGLSDVRRAPNVVSALAMVPPGPVDVVANYGAFQDARRELGHAS